MQIVVCDAINEVGFEILKKEGINYHDYSKLNKKELLENLQDAEVLITRSPTPVDENLLEKAQNLKAIVRAGVGVDNVDIEACSKRGIIVMNVPCANTIAAVELTFAHMLSCVRSFPYAHDELKNKRIWNRENWYGTELYQKKLGVIGFGNIGSRVAKRAIAFGMQIKAYDPYISSSKVTDMGGTYVRKLDELFDCDIITIHTPKTKETLGMIGKEQIAKMKDGVILINCARGGLFDELALLEGLKSKKIAFAGIDVFLNEPAIKDPLLELENITLTPHLGANTNESQQNIATQAVEQAISASKGISFPNALNLPIKTDDIPEFVKPYLNLVSKISSFAAQINQGQLQSLTLEAEGDIGKYLNSMLTFALVGALKESLGENINYVNAKFIADEKHIKTQTKTNAITNYKNKINVKLTTDKTCTNIGGVVFGDDEARIISINNFKTDFKPKGKMIVFQNNDVPGVIRDISSILSSKNINIADFRLGRDNSGLALAVILLDEKIDKATLEQLNNIPSCNWAKYTIL